MDLSNDGELFHGRFLWAARYVIPVILVSREAMFRRMKGYQAREMSFLNVDMHPVYVGKKGFGVNSTSNTHTICLLSIVLLALLAYFLTLSTKLSIIPRSLDSLFLL